MITKKDYSRAVRYLGYTLLSGGIFMNIYYYVTLYQFLFSNCSGILVGSGAIALAGFVAVTVATGLKKLEQRVEQLESKLSIS